MIVTKDTASGLVFIAAGALVVIEAQSHSMGTLLRMGPGYYPTLVGGLTILVGAALVARSFLRGSMPVPRIAWRELALLIGAILVAAVSLNRLGLVVSTLLLVVISRLAVRPVHWVGTLVLAAVLAAVAVVIFWWFLQLPLPLWPWS